MLTYSGIMKILITIFINTWYIWALIILLGIIKIFKPKIIGFLGEKEAAFFLLRLDSKKYKVINNLMTNIEGETTQIDHLIISNFGIFVVETKNYKGWISGDEFSDYWTQVIYKHKEKLYNPIKQNYGHVQALKTALKEFPNIVYFPIVVFTTRADLKVKTNTDVVYTTSMIKTIKKHQTEIISDDIRDKIYTYLNTLNITDRNLRKKHVHNINEKKNERKNKISNNICPRCGGSLIIRNSKYGSFKGCSNYPKCKFSFDIKK
jgi:hypothetical protein